MLLRNARQLPRALPRALSFRSLTTTSLKPQFRPSLQLTQSKRLGTITVVRPYSSATAQSAPNPKAYLDSGVIKPKQKVDVKKVLVIGSGGLAIGQAGEFDYSGKFLTSLAPFSFCALEPRCDGGVGAKIASQSPNLRSLFV